MSLGHWVRDRQTDTHGADPPAPRPTAPQLLGHLLVVAARTAQAEGLADGYRLGELVSPAVPWGRTLAGGPGGEGAGDVWG